MKTMFRRCLIALLLAGALGCFAVLAQKQSDQKKPSQAEPKATIKIDTELVMVPVLATDRTDSYVSDLRKEEFSVLEDGVKQQVAFAEIKEPFHIALLVDTSLSINPEDLRRVKMAAHELLEQLRGSDRVSVISFNDSVKEGCPFTGDYGAVRNAINSIPAGGGTKVYDALAYAVDSLKRVKAKRGAIIIFTDGVDWHSDSSTFEANILGLEESGVIVYPILYNNRPQTEAMLRKQKTPNLDAIFGVSGIGGAIPTTTPGEKPVQTQQTDQDVPYKPPVPKVQFPQPGRDRDRDRYPDGRGRIPGPDDRSGQPDTRRPPDPRDYPDKAPPVSKEPTVPNASGPLPANGTSPTLDNVYKTADQYLTALAETTGGELNRTEKVADLPDIYQRIVADLRNQYLLGYYPANAARDGKYRKIKIQTARKDVIIRTRPGYRASSAKP